MIAPDGSKVVYSTLQGARFPHVGNLYDEPSGNSVGFSVELCERVNENDLWHCEGTMFDVSSCVGHLTFSGVFQDGTKSGKFVINGGTDDFEGSSGSIFDQFDEQTGFYLRTIDIN